MITEGVEYDYQRDWLITNQVDFLQGYYFMPPVAVADFRSYIQRSEPAAKEPAWGRKRVNSESNEEERFSAM